MNYKSLLCFALVLSGGLLGCSTTPRSAHNPDTNPNLPIQFRTYHELYTFIAARAYGGDGMPTNTDMVLALASDTTTEIVGLANDEIPYVYLVTPHFYHGEVYDQIRGAQGNGDYYILRPLTKWTDDINAGRDRGFELIGMGEGNTLRWTNSNGKIGFVTTWHISATESPESVYEWNGKTFEQVK